MIKLVVCDMAGTTVKDNHEVEKCFAEACKQTGLDVSDERILAVQGWSKRFVFETLWGEILGENHPDIESKIETSYSTFKNILEDHYRNNEVSPTEGCLETLSFLREQGIKIALTTGFYREVTNIILSKLGWIEGLDENYINVGGSIIDMSIASDEVENGRPAPDMIQKAMKQFNITNPSEVINLGDTPSDLESGKRAGVFKSFGLINGTHSQDQLAPYDNDGLLTSLKALPTFIESTFETIHS